VSGQATLPTFPSLTVATPRLQIRQLTGADSATVAEVFADKQTQRWLPVPPDHGEFDALAWCTEDAAVRRSRGDGDHYGVVRREDDTLVGCLWTTHTDWRSRVTEVAYAKWIEEGTAVSYGHTWSAPADGWLATLPVGYADGVPRLLSNQAEILLGGRRRPVAGNVTMDQTLVWCGDDKVSAGDEAVLIGRQGDEIVTAEEWADLVGTIPYEIVTGIGRRVPRLHVGGRS
jgi:hypothetical protein